MASDKTDVTEETAVMVLAKKHMHKNIPYSSIIEVYDKTPIFIPVDIMEDVVKLVAQNLLGSLVTGGTDSEALQGWLLKFGEDSKKLCISVGFLCRLSGQ